MYAEISARNGLVAKKVALRSLEKSVQCERCPRVRRMIFYQHFNRRATYLQCLVTGSY